VAGRGRPGRAVRRGGAGAPVLAHRAAVVPLAAAHAAAAQNPTWRFAVARDVGHVPQLEAPEWTVAQILDRLSTDVVAAADRTSRR
jgi:hypothetical protein